MQRRPPLCWRKIIHDVPSTGCYRGARECAADELCPGHQGAQRPKSDIALEQDQTAISGKTKLIGRQVVQDPPDAIGYFLGGFGDGALHVDHTRPELEVLRQGVLLEHGEPTRIAPTSPDLQVEHIHPGLKGLWNDKTAVTRCRSLALSEIIDLAWLPPLIFEIAGRSPLVPPTDVADDPGGLYSFHRSIECLHRPIFESINPGKLIELA